jgi:hypothetical protein
MGGAWEKADIREINAEINTEINTTTADTGSAVI